MASARPKMLMVLMLLLTAVAASHARQIECENTAPKDITANGVVIKPGAKVLVEVIVKLEILLYDTYGKPHKGSCDIPQHVVGVSVAYVNLILIVKATKVIGLGILPPGGSILCRF